MRVLVDAHVHLYDCFALDALVASAHAQAAAHAAPVLLMLSESAKDHAFRALREARTLAPTAESLSLRAGDDAGPVFLVAGRQIVSDEDIEVLALGLDPDDPLDAQPDRALDTQALAERVLDAGAACVLPWGVGKWLGARGARVAQLVRVPRLRDAPLFFLGDVAQRCWPWPRPAPFDAGVRVLAGSDPLPVPGAERRVARYGCSVEVSFDPERPAASLLGALRAGVPAHAFGRRESLVSTLREQARYRRVRRRRT